MTLTRFVDVEGEFRAYVRMRSFSIVDARAELLGKLRELGRNCWIHCVRVTHSVADVMRKRTDREGQFVGVSSMTKQALNKVSRSHVVRQIAEELIAERIITEILYGRTAVSITVSPYQISFVQVREPALQKRLDRVSPDKID